MKRVGNLFESIVSLENLILADRKARKGKSRSYGVRLFDKHRGCNLLDLHNDLASGNYKTSDYSVFKIYEPKEREIFRLPYRDRIVHHAIMNLLEPIWVSIFTRDTYSCIKGRGIHDAFSSLRAALSNDPEGTKYALKMDVKKFYPSIDHDILKAIVRKKIKDKRLLVMIDEIIDSAPGVPIGNYLSQYFANLYLAYFDHDVKEKLKVKYYFRYADDIVVLGNDKPYLHNVLKEMRFMLSKLKLEIKDNYQIFPVASRGVDFVGYVSYHTHALLRKSIKKRFARAVAEGSVPGSPNWWSYWGWAVHCNSKHLIKKLVQDENSKITAVSHRSTTDRGSR